MNLRFFGAALAVFVLWSVVNMVMNGFLLTPYFASCASLWRPMAEMKMGLIYISTAVAAFFFTWIYARGFAGKGLGESLRFGFYWGLATGFPMAFATYGTMPLSLPIAWGWFLGAVLQSVAGGLLLALIWRKGK